jgi:predicted chitinase
MSRAAFFAQVAKSPLPSLSAPAKASINTVLDVWESRADCTDLRWLAYMLATMLGEVGTKMSTVREGFTKTDAQARAFVTRQGYRYAKEVNGHVYYGRGLVQLTWDFNYKSMGKIIGVDLYNNPDYALETENAVKIMFEGMIRGTFTGKKLAHYFNATTEDWMNARRIINGTDKMATFAQYGRAFYAAAKLLKFEDKAAPKPKLQTTAKQEAVAITTPATSGVVAESTARSLDNAVKVDVPADQVTNTLDGLQTQFQSAAATGLRIFAILCAAVTVAMALYMAWKYAKVLWGWWRGEA